METTENQPIKTRREQIAERMQSLYPDRDFTNGNSETGESGEDLLEQAILDAMTQYDNSQSEFKTKNERMNELFFGDPRSAEFIAKFNK